MSSPDPRPALLILNPTAGSARQKRLHQAVSRLTAGGYPLEQRATTRRGDAETFAREAANTGSYRAVIAAGGDGTINEVVNGLARGGLAGGATPLGLIPLGTANVLAAELDIASPAAAAEAILSGRQREICLGQCGGRYFTLMAGVGFDARVVAGIRPAEKRRLGKIAYGLQSLREWLKGSPGRLSGSLDGQPWEAGSLVLANGHFYGGRYVIAPEARLDDPALIACRFGRDDRFAILRAIAYLGLDRMPRLPDLSRQPVREIEVTGPIGAPVQADGDIIAHLPVRLTAGAARLTVLA